MEKNIQWLVYAFLLCSVFVLFLSFIWHYTASRPDYIAAQNAQSTLYVSVSANALIATPGTDEADAQILRRLLPPAALENGRLYGLVDAHGIITATLPENAEIAGLALGEILSGAVPALQSPNAMTLQWRDDFDGGAALALVDLAPYQSRLLFIHPRRALLAPWRHDVMKRGLGVALAIAALILSAAAFRWQTLRAARADGLLAGSVKRLDSALERARCGLWDWDVARGRIFWSKSMYELLGLPPGNGFLSYGAVAERLHPDDEPIDQMIDALLTGDHRAVDRDFRLRHEQGRWVWLRVRAELIHPHRGEVRQLLGIAIDITEQKRAEHDNREAELRLQDAIETISEAFVLWDESGRMVLCNSKYQQFHNLPAQLCIAGAKYEDMARASEASDPPALRKLQTQPSYTGQPGSFEVQVGQNRWLQINQRRTKDGGFVSVGTDITALKRQEDKLRKSERDLRQLAQKYDRERAKASAASQAKSQFLANMSHELRTPLNSIINFSDIMRQQMFGPVGSGQYRDYAGDIYKSGRHLLHMIENILDMSRIEQGKLSLTFESCDLAVIANDTLRMVAQKAVQAGVKLENAIDGAVMLTADAQALRQILINLLTNAIKFTPKNGRAGLSAKTEGEWVRIIVEDTGIGIPQANIARLAQPFVQVENQFTKTRSGSGLGLSITKSLVEAHGGKFQIASPSNKGVRVTVILPVAQARRRADAAPLAVAG